MLTFPNILWNICLSSLIILSANHAVLLEFTPYFLKEYIINWSAPAKRITMFIIPASILVIIIYTLQLIYYRTFKKYKNFNVDKRDARLLLDNLANSHKDRANIADGESVKIKNTSINSLYIDFIISELVFALCTIFGHGGIKAALFLPVKNQKGEQMLKLYHTNEVFEELPKIDFRVGEGFCGLAAEKKEMVCGPKTIFFGIMYHPSYKRATVKDSRRSFLCIPLFLESEEYGKNLVGVLSIDSKRKRDFCKVNACTSLVVQKLRPVTSIIYRHIRSGRYNEDLY